MSASRTVFEILSLTSKNFKRSHANYGLGGHFKTTSLILLTCVHNVMTVASVIPEL